VAYILLDMTPLGSVGPASIGDVAPTIGDLHQQRNNGRESIMRKLVLIAVVASALSGLSAAAATYVAPYGSDGPTTGLSTILDGIYGAGHYVRVSDDSDNTWWQTVKPGGALVQAKYAGNGNTLYTATTDGVLDKWVVDGVAGNKGSIAPSVNPFLFADVTSDGSSRGGNFFVSNAGLNINGEDHMVTFQVLNQVDTYVICWEDLQYGHSDLDFNDLVVQVSGVTPVPDGASTLALLGGAMAFMGAVGRKLRK